MDDLDLMRIVSIGLDNCEVCIVLLGIWTIIWINSRIIQIIWTKMIISSGIIFDLAEERMPFAQICGHGSLFASNVQPL